MGYALENELEAKRLEKQSTLNNYSLETELKNTYISPHSRVLDAGCGSGLLTRFLLDNFHTLKIEGCDASDERIQQARDLAKANQYQNANFKQQDLNQLNYHEDYFDQAFCRYVLEHLTCPLRALEEIYRVIRPGGELVAIDADGVLFNLYSDNETLNRYLETLKKVSPMDLFIGRKIPKLMKEAGFRNISYEVQLMDFQNENRFEEIKMYEERFNFTMPALIQILGAREADEFVELYLCELEKPENTLVYNKFIVTGKK